MLSVLFNGTGEFLIDILLRVTDLVAPGVI
jgi:hypothetical protein